MSSQTVPVTMNNWQENVCGFIATVIILRQQNQSRQETNERPVSNLRFGIEELSHVSVVDLLWTQLCSTHLLIVNCFKRHHYGM